MSTSGRSVPTHEEVISDLTKDFEEPHCDETGSKQEILEEDDSKAKVKVGTTGPDFPPCGGQSSQIDSCINVKEEQEGENVGDTLNSMLGECGAVGADTTEDTDKVNSAENDILDEEYIDEELLKEMEEKLSHEEKESRKNVAQLLKSKGNEQFKAEDYREAVKSYTEALRLCPLCYAKERSVMYSNRAASRMKLGCVESAIEDCSQAITLNPQYLKALLRRANLYEQSEKLDEALQDYQQVLQLDPLHREATYATKRLPEQISERNEKLKSEMMAKLKDLGNMILKPFGLSTDNFKVQQDPATGGYSVNFQQNSQNPR